MRPKASFRFSILKRPVVAFAAVVAVLAGSVTAAPRPELLISTEQLAERLSSGEFVILHVGADREGFDGGHIPGARFLEWGSIAVTQDGIPNEFPTRAELRKTFAGLGVGDGSSVVIYDAAKGLPSARAFVALELIGFDGRAAVLDGQLAAWVSEERPIQVGPPSSVGPATLTLNAADAVVVQAGEVRRAMTGGSTQLIDSRSAAEWSGEKAGRDISPMRGGHLPGAINIPWDLHLADEDDAPRLKSLAELQELYAGVNTKDPVVTYCRTGVKASHAYFVLRYLGYEPHLYDASFIGWHADAEAPVEKAAASE